MIDIAPISYELNRQGTRQTLNTPCLLLDLDALGANIAAMAQAMAGTGRQLRPHSKSHKCPEIAKAQVAAGAVGVCCATLDEAEVMAASGIPGILLTSPITTPDKIARLIALLREAPDTQVVVDNPGNARALALAARGAGLVLPVLIDIEIGVGRTGVTGPAGAAELAALIGDEDSLRYDGVQAYGGHLQHTADHAERLALSRRAHAFIGEIIAALEAIGMKPPLVTGGGTGTHDIDRSMGPFTEIQAGSYVFMDAEYELITYRPDEGWPFRNSLLVLTAVISANREGVVTTDAGTKAFALNGAMPRIVTEGFAEATYAYLGDEHGRVKLTGVQSPPAVGSKLECVPSHCDPTVAHYDRYFCVRGNELVDIWPILARGRR